MLSSPPHLSCKVQEGWNLRPGCHELDWQWCGCSSCNDDASGHRQSISSLHTAARSSCLAKDIRTFRISQSTICHIYPRRICLHVGRTRYLFSALIILAFFACNLTLTVYFEFHVLFQRSCTSIFSLVPSNIFPQIKNLTKVQKIRIKKTEFTKSQFRYLHV